MFELNVPINSFEDGNIYDYGDNIDNTYIRKVKEEEIMDVIIIGENMDNTPIQHL